MVEIGNAAEGCAPNQIQGSVNLGANTAPTAVLAANLITGNLNCSTNSPAPVNNGRPNLVRGRRTSQCAGL